jgi:hypothetical protein
VPPATAGEPTEGETPSTTTSDPVGVSAPPVVAVATAVTTPLSATRFDVARYSAEDFVFSNGDNTAECSDGPKTLLFDATLNNPTDVVRVSCRVTGNSSWAVGLVPQPEYDSPDFLMERGEIGVNSEGLFGGCMDTANMHEKILVIEVTPTLFTVTADGSVVYEVSRTALQLPARLGFMCFDGAVVDLLSDAGSMAVATGTSAAATAAVAGGTTAVASGSTSPASASASASAAVAAVSTAGTATPLAGIRFGVVYPAFDQDRASAIGFNFSNGGRRVSSPSGPKMVISDVAIANSSDSTTLSWKIKVSGNNSWSVGVVPESARGQNDFLYKTTKVGYDNRGLSGGHLTSHDMHDKDLEVTLSASEFTVVIDGGTTHKMPMTESFPAYLAISGFNGTNIDLLSEPGKKDLPTTVLSVAKSTSLLQMLSCMGTSATVLGVSGDTCLVKTQLGHMQWDQRLLLRLASSAAGAVTVAPAQSVTAPNQPPNCSK